MAIKIKRIYEPPADSDGIRILVDRIWPRGISRYDAHIEFWEKDVAPTTELRKWFGHKPERWAEFRRRYRAELKHNPAVEALRKFARRRLVSLLYAAHDQEHNHALVLAAFLRLRASPRKPVKTNKSRSRRVAP
jgi:uncharacterized protein YeaO (DUF488 family)